MSCRIPNFRGIQPQRPLFSPHVPSYSRALLVLFAAAWLESRRIFSGSKWGVQCKQPTYNPLSSPNPFFLPGPVLSCRSLNVGMQRPGLASVPTLLLALGLALAATPTSGDLTAGWGGLRASLAANFLLAVRAIAAKVRRDLS